jgi:hypothetical protein
MNHIRSSDRDALTQILGLAAIGAALRAHPAHATDVYKALRSDIVTLVQKEPDWVRAGAAF